MLSLQALELHAFAFFALALYVAEPTDLCFKKMLTVANQMTVSNIPDQFDTFPEDFTAGFPLKSHVSWWHSSPRFRVTS